VLRGIAEQVLDDPLEHRGVGAHHGGRDLERELPVRDQLVRRHDLAQERTHVDPRVVRHRHAAREPLDVQEVAHHAIEPPRVLRDPVGEIARLARLQRGPRVRA
jgi:hypothetical protein